jgi:hypothetical protein
VIKELAFPARRSPVTTIGRASTGLSNRHDGVRRVLTFLTTSAERGRDIGEINSSFDFGEISSLKLAGKKRPVIEITRTRIDARRSRRIKTLQPALGSGHRRNQFEV